MEKSEILYEVYKVIQDRKNNPKENSYTNYLLNNGIDKVLKKIGEETTETIIAAKNTDNKEIVMEISDLLYHISVLMVMKDISWESIYDELAIRELKKNNLKEFNKRGEI